MSFKPLKACDWDETKVKFPLLAQPKIDGVRGLHPKDFMVARTLNRHANKFVSTSPKYNNSSLRGIDSELTLGDDITRGDLCRITSSALSTIEGEPNIFINAFDICDPCVADVPYQKRYDMLQQHVYNMNRAGFNHIKIVESHLCKNLDEFLELEERWLDLGIEGGILRALDGRYKHGRSTVREQYSMRVKRFVDEEAIIVGFTEAMENLNEATVDALGYTKRSSHQANKVGKGMVGNIIMHNDEMGDFEVGPGNLTHEERVIMWVARYNYIGKIGKFKHFPRGRKVGYRFPTFISLRDPNDM